MDSDVATVAHVFTKIDQEDGGKVRMAPDRRFYTRREFIEWFPNGCTRPRYVVYVSSNEMKTTFTAQDMWDSAPDHPGQHVKLVTRDAKHWDREHDATKLRLLL